MSDERSHFFTSAAKRPRQFSTAPVGADQQLLTVCQNWVGNVNIFDYDSAQDK